MRFASENSVFVRFIAVAVFGAALAQAPRAAEPTMPPGVKLLPNPPAADQVPIGVSVRALEVDWTNPLLSVRLELGLGTGRARPVAWGRIAEDRPGSIRIQLAEPVRGERGWGLALKAELPRPRRGRTGSPSRGPRIDPPTVPTATQGADDNVRVGGIAPWFFAGPRAEAGPQPVSPLGEGSSRVDVRWLGDAQDWRAHPPDLQINPIVLLSTFDPVTGHSIFYSIENQTGSRLPLSFVTGWITAAAPWGGWIAVHSIGPHARMGTTNWFIEVAPGGAASRWAGAVLILDSVGSRDAVDIARIYAPKVRASSFETDFPPETITSGRLWPAMLDPPLWTSRSSQSELEKMAWIELELPQARAVHQIRLIYAEAAGWSSHFNPARLEVFIRRGGQSRRIRLAELIDPRRAYTTIDLDTPENMDLIRIEFARPTRFDLPSPARLMAVQLIGSRSRR